MKTFTVKIGKGPDEMTFDECMVHIKRVLFWDYIDGEWCDVVPLSDRRWDELAVYIRGAHEREVDALKSENAKLRELVNCYADLFEKEAATNNGHGPYYSGEDWLALANDMRIDLAKCCGELGIEVE